MSRFAVLLGLVMTSTLIDAGPLEEGNRALQEHRYEDAYKLLLPEARKGNPNAQYNVALLLSQGMGVPKDESEGVRWYAKASASGDLDAAVNLGLMYQEGRGVAQDEREAFRLFLKAAQGGNPLAENDLASAYLSGRGTRQDDANAVRWFTTAAEGGNAVAQNSLGGLYMEGRGVPKDGPRGFEWIKRAAEQGYVPAQQNVFHFTLKGAAKGDLQAMHNVGGYYLMGLGVAADPKEGLAWLSKAAEAGFKESQKTLAGIYSTGSYGVAKDAETAKRWRIRYEQSK